MTRYTSRKFWLCVLIYAGTFTLSALGKIDSSAYSFAVAALIGSYIAGNVTQKVKAPESPTSAL